MIGILHLSDYHNVKGKMENHPVLLNAFFQDLAEQIPKLKVEKLYLAFTGDIVQSADEADQYDDFLSAFDHKLNSLGIPKENRIIVPGNHDVSQKHIRDKLVEHEGVVSQTLSEEKLNDYLSKNPALITGKFENYFNFQKQFALRGITRESVGGYGWNLDEDIGIYCLNSAILSSGGLKDGSKELKDKRRLRIDTRSLHDWVQKTPTKLKILLMHHPLHWLAEIDEAELKIIVQNHFNLRLFGHEHEQDAVHRLVKGGGLVDCCAPAFFSRKGDDLGYSIILLDGATGVHELVYRQWTKRQKFVAGVNFADNDSGRILISHPVELKAIQQTTIKDAVTLMLSKSLDDSLVSFAGQPIIWSAPVLKTAAETDKEEISAESIDIDALISNPTSTVVVAPPQFGLTCLSRFLVKEAWIRHKNPWLYLDLNELKPNANSIQSAIERAMAEMLTSIDQVKCIVLDSISTSNTDFQKIFNKLLDCHKSIPIIAMHAFEPGLNSGANKLSLSAPDSFRPIYLWPLHRNHIRTMVSKYNDIRPIGDEDAVITRITSDLEVLNLHRTPLNCITLLKVSELDFDESPVNRSEMIKRVLFLLFNINDLPTYKSKPDLKDCEYVLGYFCETLLRKNVYYFSRTHFLSTLQECCKERFIDLEIQVVFDVLNENNILVCRGGQFTFKFSFWIYYFAAVRMHHSREFADFIFANMRYANHPELIEFYTGVDRQRSDALTILTNDLVSCREKVEAHCGFPHDFDPFGLAQWTPSPAAIERMRDEIREGIRDSNLPAVLKDKFADNNYDNTRPYNQQIDLLSDSSVVYLINTLRAASKALRNSDYVDPGIKKKLLDEIMHCWEQLTIVLLVVLPSLAKNGNAEFNGANFVLQGDFGATIQDRIQRILVEIPGNIIRWSRDDLLSQKMGPLLIDAFNREKVALRKHEMVLLLIEHKPRGWSDAVQLHITSIGKNSFYLLDTYRALRNQYRFSYVSKATLKEIEHLIKMAATKHVTGAKEPGIKLIEKTVPKISGNPLLPDRDI